MPRRWEGRVEVGGFGIPRSPVHSLWFRHLTALISSLLMPRLLNDFPRRLRGSGGGGAANEMLVLMLLAAATLRLCPLARAQPLCRWGLPPGLGYRRGSRRGLAFLSGGLGGIQEKRFAPQSHCDFPVYSSRNRI